MSTRTINPARFAWLAALVATAAACTPPSTALVIRVDSNLVPRTELQSFTLTVQRGTAVPFSMTDYSLIDPHNVFPATISVIPHDVTDTRPLNIVVVGHENGGATITQRASVTLSFSHVSLLDIFLASECVDGSMASMCPSGQTCSRGGICVPIVHERLPDFGADASDASDATTDDINTDVVPPMDVPLMDATDASDDATDVPHRMPDVTDVVVPSDAQQDVTSECVPNCTGRTCGSDSCGGSCGTCGSGVACSTAGQCICSGMMVTDCGGRCVNINTDPLNCGSCSHVCPSGTNGTPACRLGMCMLTCATGTADCDRSASNGCETPLGNDSACGGCFDACTAGNACNTTIDVSGTGQCCQLITGSGCPGTLPSCAVGFGYCQGNIGYCCVNSFTSG